MSFKKIISVALLGLSFISLNGCIAAAAAAAGGGTIAYINGDYTMNQPSTVDDVYNATLKAIQNSNNYIVVSKSATESNAKIEGAEKTKGDTFSVKVKKLTDNASKVTIKFGTFGDQVKSSTLMDKIQSNLK